jgi:hypothetical protein
MIKLALYGYGIYWLLSKVVKKDSKNTTMQGLGTQHPLSCFCPPHRHPELEKRIQILEEKNKRKLK